MSRAVAHNREGFRVLLREQPESDFTLGGEGATEVDLAAIDLGQDRSFGQTGANAGSHVVRRDGSVKLFTAAIRQDYDKHGRPKTVGTIGLRGPDNSEDVGRTKVRAQRNGE